MLASARRTLAAALMLGALGLAAPASAAPLAPDAGLAGPDAAVLAVQYGYGRGHHHGWGHRHHHGPRFGHHRGHHWGHHHGGRGHHHHGRHHHGRHHHGHW